MKRLVLLLALLVLVVPSLSLATVEDDFDRADSSTLGTATNGNVWTETENSGTYYISGNRYNYTRTSIDDGLDRTELEFNVTTPESVDFRITLRALPTGTDFHGFELESGTATTIVIYYSPASCPVSTNWCVYNNTYNDLGVAPTTNQEDVFSIRNIDYANDKADVYINGNLALADVGFQNNVASIDHWNSATRDNTGGISTGYFMDDLLTDSLISLNFTITAADFYDSSVVQEFNATVEWNGTTTNYTTSSGIITTNIPGDSGLANVTVTATNYFSNSTTGHNTSSNLDQTLTPYTAVYAENALNGGSISSFSVSYDGSEYSTSSGVVYLPLFNESSNVSVSAIDYNSDSALLNASVYLENYTFGLYPDPSSVRVNIFDGDSGASLSGTNVSVVVSGNASEDTYYTSNASLFVGNLTADTYSFKFSASNYTTRNYLVSVGVNTSQVLNAYLVTSTSQVLFTIVDDTTDEVLSGASITMDSFVNGSRVSVQSQLSDIAGQASFLYTEDLRYIFTITVSGYSSKVFTLDPIQIQPGETSAFYTIRMTPTQRLSSTQSYSGYSVVYTPKTFYNNNSYNLSVTFSSAAGVFVGYNATVCVPGDSCYTSSGTSATGETLLFPFTINITGYDKRVNVSYAVETSSGAVNNNSFSHLVINLDTSGKTFLDNECTAFGLGVLECALLGTVLLLLTVGAVALYAGAAPAGVVALLMLGVLYYLGFFSLWSILISLLVGFVVVVWRSGT